MPRYADPNRCPDCRSVIPEGPRTSCASCRLPLQGQLAADLFATLHAADVLLLQLRAQVAVRTPSYVQATPVPPRPQPRPQRTAPPVTWTVPAVLLGLGALCLLVGAVVFLAVTWAVLGVGGRTAVLIGFTAAAAAATGFCARRGLRGAAEALALVTSAFLALDVAGAFTAGWLGDPASSTATLVGSLAVAAALTAANLGLRTARTGQLVSPQVVAALSTLVAVPAALVRFSDHPTVTAAVSVCLLAGAASASWGTRQRVLAVGLGSVAGLAWLSLLLDGAANVLDHGEPGVATLAWPEVAPLLVAAGLAGALALLPLRQVEIRQLAGIAACWLTGVATALATVTTPTGLVVLASAGAVLCATGAVASPRRAPAVALGVAATGYAAVGAFLALGPVAELAGRLGVAVEDADDLFTRAAEASSVGVAAGWTIPVAASALVAAIVSLGVRGRYDGLVWSAALVAWPVGCVTLLWYVPSLLLAVVATAGAAALHLASWLRDGSLWGRRVDVACALGWTLVAGLLASYHPATSLAVATACATVATVGALRGSRPLAASAPVLVATAAASCGWLVDWPVAWATLATVVTVCLHALALGARRVETRGWVYAAALPTAGLAAVIGSATLPDPAAWMAPYLVVMGAAAAAVAVVERSREAAWVAAGLQLGAMWVRLADAEVRTVEAYTLPLAGVLLAFGAWTLWRDPEVRSDVALAPGLTAAAVPSLLLVASDPVSLRALLLGAFCGLALLVAAIWRLRAPLVVGAGVGAALVVVELAPYHDAVPRWFVLGLAGLVLLVAGIRWEHLATVGRRSWGRVAELR